MNVAKREIVIGSVVSLDHGLSRFFTGKNLNRSLGLSTTNIRVARTPHMVFTNIIMTTHVHKTINKPPMNLIAIKRFRNTNVEDLKGGYQRPFVITQGIPNYRNGHFVKSNKVAFKYLDFKKNVDPNVHVRMFNYTIKANAETSKEYIINVFNYMLEFLTIHFRNLHMHFANVIRRFRMTSKYTWS